MNPIDVATTLHNRYVSYLTTMFAVTDAYRPLHDRFEQLLYEPGQLIAGPYLEATAPYRVGEHTLQDLVDAGLLHQGFTNLLARRTESAAVGAPPRRGGGFFGRSAGAVGASGTTAAPPTGRERLPADRRLYHHQEAALRRLCSYPDREGGDRDTVVASGTGSGKTECFLLPAIDWILRHPTRDESGRPGVGRGIRALLVYPMNALVNDQIRRLRQVVGYDHGGAPVPVTFARYTSETCETEAEGRRREPDAPVNQLLGRQEILANPPDLLITNFAMLEQALLRPRESPFFSAVDAHAWRLLILDEAHSYRGAQAIELARLMQRVRAAVRRGKRTAGVPTNEPVCVATSATLADPRDDETERRRATAAFAGSLFGRIFDPASVLFAEREDPTAGEPTWKFSDPAEETRSDAAWEDLPGGCLADLTGEADDAFATQFRGLAPAPVWQAAAAQAGDRPAFLYHLLKGHPRFHWLWGRIREEPVRVTTLADEWARRGEVLRAVAVERLVAACNAARRRPEEQPLLPCRYHLFASALEGVFLDLAADDEQPAPDWDVPGLRVRELAVRRLRPDDRVAFELARCEGCGLPFVVLDPAPQDRGLDQPPAWERPVTFLAFAAHQTEGPPLTPVTIDLATGDRAAGETTFARTLYEVPGSSNGTDVQTCPHCGRDHRHYRVAGRFQTGQDAPVSVLTEELYGQLPALTQAQEVRVRSAHPHRQGGQNDPFVGGGRKLLMFSDSRQNAAFMASYLQDHSNEYLVRELAFDALRAGGSESLTFGDWVNGTLQQIHDRKLNIPFLVDRDLADLDGSPFRGSYPTAVSDRRNLILKALIAESVGTQPLTLESLGLAEFPLQLDRRPEFAGDPTEEIRAWCNRPITRGDLGELLDRTFRLLRRQYLMTKPPDVEWPGFSQRQNYLVLEKQPNAAEQLHGFWKAAGQDTVYVDLVKRWGHRRVGRDPSDAEIRDLLGWLFEGIHDTLGDWVEVSNEAGVTAIAVRHDSVRSRRPASLWKCDRCDAFASTFLAGVCPEPRCRGRLAEVAPAMFPERRPGGHMFTERFVSGQRVEMRCEEHTAQLSPEHGQDVQDAFQCGQVNVLSCSTTFEMGIDIGDLQAITLRNVPPSTVNYLQRAGRAGRRSDAVAFVLTFCQRRSHDRHYFQRPPEMIAGRVRPPRIDLDNEKILQRHCFAEILSEYWVWLDGRSVGGQTGRFERAGNVGSFFEDRLDGTNGTPYDHLRAWLAGPKQRAACANRLRDAFDRFPPGADPNSYLDVLADPNADGPNPLARAADEITRLLGSFKEGEERHRRTAESRSASIDAARAAGDHARAEEARKDHEAEGKLSNSFARLLRQQRREFLISFLMGRGVLPSFAFPVNVVRLHIMAEEMREGTADRESRLKLERDGKIGLGDYAPDARVVAGKRVYHAIGLRKFPALEFNWTDWYRWCSACNHIELWSGVEQPGDLEPACPVCGLLLRSDNRLPRQWVLPRWGYVTDVKAKGNRPRGQRPWRPQTTRAFFLDGRPTHDAAGGAGAAQAEIFPARGGEVWGEGRYARGRALLVLNLGEFEFSTTRGPRRTGFKVCDQCGRAVFNKTDTERRHRPPYSRFGRTCSGPIGLRPKHDGSPVALGHRYETDIVWLDFHGAGRGRTETGFWLSLAYALANAAGVELNIERGDLEATCVPLDGDDRQAVVLYDAVPGGAGHCRQILQNLPAVVRKARDLLAACNCDPDSTGCYGCLCDYQNQYAHAQLSRGPALAYLCELVDALDRDNPDPWRKSSASPCREVIDSLRSATGSVTLAVDRVEPGVLPGLGQDWFDVMKEVSLRPCGAGRLSLLLGRLPEYSRDPAQAIAFHRLAELQGLGVRVGLVNEVPPHAVLSIDHDGPLPHVLWRWPWATPLGPAVDGVCRNRIGREADAAESVGRLPAAQSADFSQLGEFHHFVLYPGVRRDPGDERYLGRLMRHPVRRLLLIDPFILSGPTEAAALERFLDALHLAEGAEVHVKAGPVPDTAGRYHFQTAAAQQTVVDRLSRRFPALRIRVPARGRLVEHDRVILFDLSSADGPRQYRALLGQGLFGFEDVCRRQSEGVWFRVSPDQFESDWGGF